jgi:hypothetical protein
MSGEPSLYEKVWGESPPEPPEDESRPASAQLAFQRPPASRAEPAPNDAGGIIPARFSSPSSARADPGRPVDGFTGATNDDGADNRVLVRLDAIEATLLRLQSAGIETRQQLEACVAEVSRAVSELHRSVHQSKDASSSQERMLSALEALEARMARTEKGLIRTLEYFQLKLSDSDRLR